MNCKSARVWVKSALLEWETDNESAEKSLLEEGIRQYPDCAKLYLMLGQLYEAQSNVDQARATYRNGLLHCAASVPLWLLYVRLERRVTSIMKARSLLEVARQKCPTSEDLWIESVRMERDAGNTALANQLLSKARQMMPSNGRIWSETIATIPKIQRRSYISTALKESEVDAYVFLAAGKLFWSLHLVSKARVWLRRALAKNGDIGDFWALLYIFELQNGTEEQQNEVIRDCVRANPKHGEIWPSIRKQKENRRKEIPEILRLVADQMKDVMVEFCK